MTVRESLTERFKPYFIVVGNLFICKIDIGVLLSNTIQYFVVFWEGQQTENMFSRWWWGFSHTAGMNLLIRKRGEKSLVGRYSQDWGWDELQMAAIRSKNHQADVGLDVVKFGMDVVFTPYQLTKGAVRGDAPEIADADCGIPPSDSDWRQK